jgi:hypothetical protein
LDPERYFYVRDRICSSYEVWGLNHNGDGFPRNELIRKYLTFVGSRVSVDHKDSLLIGMVPDSIFIPSEFHQSGEMKVKGDFVENILACDKKQTDKIGNLMGIKSLSDKILAGEVHDTSMGCYANYTECSICGNLAYKPEDFCKHIDPNSNLKGSTIKLASGEEKMVGEVCHDFYFFEDAIIVPLHLGGLAGGRGADPNSKILERIASEKEEFPLQEFIITRKLTADGWNVPSPSQSMPGGGSGGFDTDQNKTSQPSSSTSVQLGDKPEDVEEGEKDERERQIERTEEEEEKKVVIAATDEKDDKATKIAQDAYAQLQEMVKQGKKIPEAIDAIRKIYDQPYKEALGVKASGLAT